MDIHTLCEKTLVGLGYELVHLEYITGKTMSLFIDRQPSGVTIEDCVAVSQHFTRLLAAENIDYTRLEVSSPGLDRTLRTQADFLRSIGKLIYIKTKIGAILMDKKKSMTGRLLSVEKDQLFLDLGDSTINVALSAISKARLEPELIEH